MADLQGSMRVLITGGAGYIGSGLCRDLLAHGCEIVVLDRFLFGEDSLSDLRALSDVRVERGDVRDAPLVERCLRDVDAVVHLAAVVGEPACGLAPELAQQVNVDATRQLLQLARRASVSRVVLASTCSVYGPSTRALDETSEPRPQGAYACSKAEAESLALAASGNGLDVVALRFATLHGLSPRPRLDLVVNALTGHAVRTGRMSVFNGGQWRPFMHVADAGRAILHALRAPAERVAGRAFNAGSDAEVCTIHDVAAIVRERVPGAEIQATEDASATPGYRVLFGRGAEALGFRPKRTLRDGVQELAEALRGGLIGEAGDPRYSNVETLRKRIEEFGDDA